MVSCVAFWEGFSGKQEMRKDPEPDTEEDYRWTPHEVILLHEMVRNYDRKRWLGKQVVIWGLWLLGLPAFALTVWEPLVRLWKLLKGS